MRFVAVDWSGRASGAAARIWVAEVVEGRLAALTSGRSREATVAYLKGLVDERVVVGLDFAFSAPAWWLDAQGLGDAPELWGWLAEGGAEELLRERAAPFWGWKGSRRAAALRGREALRRTERATPGARSVFQVGGAGSVGTGSLRGMALLPELAEGYAIWPWAVGSRVALEIYPRALTGRVVKSSQAARREHLRRQRFSDQPPELLELAACSEDAFDAAVSAIALAAAGRQLAALSASADPLVRREGAIWTPA